MIYRYFNFKYKMYLHKQKSQIKLKYIANNCNKKYRLLKKLIQNKKANWKILKIYHKQKKQIQKFN